MKTYPIYTDNGELRGFEITSYWVRFAPLYKILKSVNGVAEVKRNWFNEDRIIFLYHGKKAVINEPWGDNSRYWVGIEDPELASGVDIQPLHEAFIKYRGLTLF